MPFTFTPFGYVTHNVPQTPTSPRSLTTMADIMDINGENTVQGARFPPKRGASSPDRLRWCATASKQHSSAKRRARRHPATDHRGGKRRHRPDLRLRFALPIRPGDAVCRCAGGRPGPKTISFSEGEETHQRRSAQGALKMDRSKASNNHRRQKRASIKQGWAESRKSAGRIGIGHALPCRKFVEEIRKFPGRVTPNMRAPCDAWRLKPSRRGIICSVTIPKSARKSPMVSWRLRLSARVIGAGPGSNLHSHASGSR